MQFMFSEFIFMMNLHLLSRNYLILIVIFFVVAKFEGMTQVPKVALLYSGRVLPPNSNVSSRGVVNLVEYVEILPTSMDSLISVTNNASPVDFHETGIYVNFLSAPKVVSFRDLSVKLAVNYAHAGDDEVADNDMCLHVCFDVLVCKNTGTAESPVITRDRYLDTFHGFIVSGGNLEFKGLNYMNIYLAAGESLCFAIKADPIPAQTTAITGLSVNAHGYLDQN